MIYLFDKAKTLLTVVEPQQITEHQQEITLNGLITAAASSQYTTEVEQAQFFGAKDIDDEGIFWMYKIDRLAKTDGMALLDGTYVLFDDLAGRGIMKDRRPSNEGAATVLADILEGTGWQVGTINTTHTGTANFYYVSKLTAFWDFLKKWRVEFKPRITVTGSTITGRYIDIADQISQDYGKWYEYGSDLLTITAERAAVPYTAFVGRGKGEETGDGYGRRITFEGIEWTTPTDPVNKPMGQAWVEIPEGTAAFGYEDGSPRIGIVEFPEITDPAALLQATYEHALANARPAVQFSSNVIETGRAEAGETVTVLRPDIGIRYKTRIFKYKRNFLTGKVRSVEFGDQLQASTAQRAAEMAAEAKAKEIESLTLLQTLRNAITAAYFNTDGYNYDLAAGNVYGLPGGYYSFDAPIDESPTQAIYMGAGKLLISNSKDPTGQWVWQVAADGNGLVADAITTGILNANLITAGILKGGKVNWDLENGTFYIGDSLATANLRWDGTSLYINGNSIDITGNTTITALDGRLDSAELKITPTAITSTVRSSTGYKTDLNGKEQTIVKQTTAPSHLNGKLWLDTSVTPNILKRSNGSAWVKVTPTTAGEVGAYSSADGSALAGRVTTAETAITQNATDITLKVAQSTYNDDKLTLATKSEVTQTANDLTVKFSQIGGRNLIKNSNFAYGEDNWGGIDGGIKEDGDLKYITIVGNFDVSQAIHTDEGQTYTISALVRKSTSADSRFRVKFDIDNADTLEVAVNNSEWKRISTRRVATTTGSQVLFFHTRNTFPIDMTELQIETGQVATDWSPHPSELTGATYSFDGDKFKIGGFSGDFVEHTNSQSRYTHSDGSYTQIGVNGMERFVSGTGQKYHYLVHAMTFIQGASGTTRWLQLPDEFKGKQFSIYLAIADTISAESTRNAIQRIVVTKDPANSIDYANARVPVIAYKTVVDMVSPFTSLINTVQGMLLAIY